MKIRKYQGFIQAIFMSGRRHKKLSLIEFSNSIYIKCYFKIGVELAFKINLNFPSPNSLYNTVTV